MKFLDYDSPLMGILSKVADLIILNIVMVIFCVPFITAGASITAAHYTALKIRRGEGHVWSNFWKSFKVNLKQSTGIWLIFVLDIALAIIALGIAPSMGGSMGIIMQGVIMGVVVISAFLYAWVFPLQSRFINNVKTTFKNAFYFAFKYFFRTILMALVNLLPIGVLVLIFLFMYLQGFGIWILFGASVPIYWCAMTYDKIFEKLEDAILEQENNEQENNE